MIVVVGVLTAIGCCIILCVRGPVQWLTETALLKQMTMELPPYSAKEIMRRWKAKKKSIKLHLRERFCQNQQFIKKEKGGIVGIEMLFSQSYILFRRKECGTEICLH